MSDPDLQEMGERGDEHQTKRADLRQLEQNVLQLRAFAYSIWMTGLKCIYLEIRGAGDRRRIEKWISQAIFFSVCIDR